MQMNTGSIASIEHCLEQALAAGPDACATMEVSGNSDRWVQFTGHVVNAAYPHTEAPDRNAAVKPLLGDLAPTLVNWEAGQFATFEFATTDAAALARWIDGYFILVLGCRRDFYAVKARIEDL